MSAKGFFLEIYSEPVENLTVFEVVSVAYRWALERVPKDFGEVCIVIKEFSKVQKYKAELHNTVLSLISTPFQLLKICHLILSHQRL